MTSLLSHLAPGLRRSASRNNHKALNKRKNTSAAVSSRRRDPFMVLSGGLSYDTVGRRACLTVMHGKSTTVLEMDFPIVDFLTLCETPYPNGEPQKCKLFIFLFFVFCFFFLLKYLPFEDFTMCSLASFQISRNRMLWWPCWRRI